MSATGVRGRTVYDHGGLQKFDTTGKACRMQWKMTR
jgi:hypothetical protein